MKSRVFKSQDSTGRDLGSHLWIWCPACDTSHRLRFRMPDHPTQQELDDLKNNVHGLWTFNGDTEHPTCTPSLLVFADDPKHRCHSYITNGNIIFQTDCGHAMRGTVPLPDLPAWLTKDK